MATVTLLESGSRQRVTGGTGMTALSVLLHGTLIGAAVLYTLHAGIQSVHEQLEHKVVFLAPPPPDAPKPVVKSQEPPPPKPVVKSQDKSVFVPPKLEAPPLAIPTIMTVPTTIAPPRVDIPAGVFDTLGKGVAQQGPGGHGDAVPGVDGNQVFTAETVDLEARSDPRRTVPPQYPSSLQNAGIEGTVVARFVVDQDGTVDMDTFKVISSTNERFTDAVRTSLRRTRYLPAQSGGKAVRQLVEQPFDFHLSR